MGAIVSITYSDGVQLHPNGWYILDGRKAPVWWDGKGYVFGGA